LLSNSSCGSFDHEALNRSSDPGISNSTLNSSHQCFQSTASDSDPHFVTVSNAPSESKNDEHSVAVIKPRSMPYMPQESPSSKSFSGGCGSNATQAPAAKFSSSLQSSLAKASSTRNEDAPSSTTIPPLSQGTKSHIVKSSSPSKTASRSWSMIASSKPVAKQRNRKSPPDIVHQNNEDVKAALNPPIHSEPISRDTEEASHVLRKHDLEQPSAVSKHSVSKSASSSLRETENGSKNQQQSIQKISPSPDSSLKPKKKTTLLSLRDKSCGLSSGDTVGVDQSSETSQKYSTSSHKISRDDNEFRPRNDRYDQPIFTDGEVVLSQKGARSSDITVSRASRTSLAARKQARDDGIQETEVDTKEMTTNELGSSSSGDLHSSEAEARAPMFPDQNKRGVCIDARSNLAAPEHVEIPRASDPDPSSFIGMSRNKKNDVTPITADNAPKTRPAFSYASIASRQLKEACARDKSPHQANEQKTKSSSLQSSGPSSHSNIERMSSGFQQLSVPGSASARFGKAKDLKSTFDTESPTHSSTRLPVPTRTQNNHQRTWAKQGTKKWSNRFESQYRESSSNLSHGQHCNKRQENTKGTRGSNSNRYSDNKIDHNSTKKLNIQADESVAHVVESNPTEKGKVWVSGVVIRKKKSTAMIDESISLKRWADESDSDDE